MLPLTACLASKQGEALALISTFCYSQRRASENHLELPCHSKAIKFLQDEKYFFQKYNPELSFQEAGEMYSSFL